MWVLYQSYAKACARTAELASAIGTSLRKNYVSISCIILWIMFELYYICKGLCKDCRSGVGDWNQSQWPGKWLCSRGKKKAWFRMLLLLCYCYCIVMLAPNAHSWVWQGLVPLVTGASFRQQINSCVWPSNQTHTIKVTTKIILSSAGPMSHACPVWPHPLPLAYYVILCIYVSIIIIIFGFLAAVALPPS